MEYFINGKKYIYDSEQADKQERFEKDQEARMLGWRDYEHWLSEADGFKELNTIFPKSYIDELKSRR